MLSRFLPNINWVRAAICPAVVFIATAMDRGYQTDFWHHIARGREIAETGKPVGTGVDNFTFTVAGQAVRDANWLTQLGYFKLHEIGGLPLVQTVNSAILALTAAVIVWICRRRGAPVAAAAGIALFTFAGVWQTLLIRPQTVSLLLFVVMYATLLEAEARRRLLILPPLMMVLWVNVHGGFPIGLVLIGAFLAGTIAEQVAALIRRHTSRFVERQDIDGGLLVPISGDPVARPARDNVLNIRGRSGMVQALVTCLLVSIAATFLNPYGDGIYEYVLTLSKRAAGRQVEEWLPPSMGLWVGRAFVVSLAGLIVLLLVTRRRPRVRDVVVALCFLPLAFSSVRMVPWWLFAVAPVFAVMIPRVRAVGLPDTRAGAQRLRCGLHATVMLLLIATAVALSAPMLERYNPVLGTLRSADRPESNVDAMVDRLRASGIDDARVFTRLEWGEYLDWAAYPTSRVFMDARIEIFPDDVWREYHAITSARDDWQTLLDRRGVNYLLLDKSMHGELLNRVERNAGWQHVDGAGPALLYARRGSADPALTDVRD